MRYTFETLEWLGMMIAKPLQPDHKLPHDGEASLWIAPSSTLKPHERVQIYHQQYWWRLLNSLKENFPTLHRLFDCETFQQKLAIPFLSTNPPSHWALCRLGETFPEWLELNYIASDHYLMTHLAQIDRAVNQAFWAGNHPTVDFSKLTPEETLSQVLVLQPHIHLFSLEGDLFSFRETVLKNPPGHYNANNFPSISYEKEYFVLYRTPQNVVSWKKISHAEMVTLSLFTTGNTIDRVCAVLEEQGGVLLEEALSQIPFWFKQWTVLSWFGRPS